MAWGARLGHYVRDLRYGLRMWRKNPAFTIATVVTLGLGIGANTAIFSLIDAVLLRPLPYPDSGRLMVIWEKPPRGDRNSVSAATYLDWREQSRSFSYLAAFGQTHFNLSGTDQPERVAGMRATWDLFPMLGIRPMLGRSFRPEEDRAGSPHVAILSYGLWQRKFGGDRQAIGRTVSVDSQPCTIVGVLPSWFRFFYGPEIWLPLGLDRATASRDFHYLAPVGRLRKGVSLAQARAELSGIAKNIERANPKTNQGWGAFIEAMGDAAAQGQQQGLWVLFGAVGSVLLIACVNVANLLLAKAAVRQRELAVRAAMGAGRSRLVAQLLLESVLLALAGGVLGLLLALWLVKTLRVLVPASALAGFAEIAVDWRVLGFTVALSLLTGLLFGVFPAWRASALNLHDVLKEGGRGFSGASSHARFRSVLVVAEVALSLVLLVSAGLMIRSLAAMQNVDPGFRADHLLTMGLATAETRYPGPAAIRLFYRQVLDNAIRIPGVESASISAGLPLLGAEVGMPFQVASHRQIPAAEAPGAPFEMVTHDFFRTMGMPLRRGRYFSERDNENSVPVAIVNQTFVKKYLPNEEPVNKRLLIEALIAGRREAGPTLSWQIVGVVSDAKYGGLNGRDVAVIYVPMPQSPWPGGVLALRTSVEPLAVASAARAAVARVDRETPVTAVRTMEEIASDSLAQSRVQTWLIGSFAVIALIMAALGVYGLISYSVAQSTHDVGVRIALGANARDVLRLVLRKGMLLTGAGLLLGLGGAFALTRLLAALLFGVKPTDLATFVAVSILLAAVALVAGFIPARRATRIDPVAALRME